MSRWETESALHLAEREMLVANVEDRDLIGDIERRMKGRSHLIKMLRRYFRQHGLVNVSGDTLNPQWLPKDAIR